MISAGQKLPYVRTNFSLDPLPSNRDYKALRTWFSKARLDLQSFETGLFHNPNLPSPGDANTATPAPGFVTADRDTNPTLSPNLVRVGHSAEGHELFFNPSPQAIRARADGTASPSLSDEASRRLSDSFARAAEGTTAALILTLH